MAEAILLERQDAVAILSNNDPPYNRMTLEFMDELEARVNDLAADGSIRAVVITAQGLENFSVGMNLKQIPEAIQRMGSMDAVLDQRLRVIAAIEKRRR